MTLARSLPDSPTEWWIYLGAFAVYVLTRLFLAWHQARKEGADHPLRAAFSEEEPEESSRPLTIGSFRSYRQILGFVAGTVVIVMVATLTDGALRVVLMCTLAPVIVAALAYLDFRLARTARLRAEGPSGAARRTHRSA
ncbi:hypothetical protein E6R60_18515 [Streptomyces sp. A0642]|uniref:hypothetical protein n=1 Tax=Streptomyces sp. A0642 TaxID=2563100 RepID=UPI0010A28EE5|nr:hypothetical protein [Streptomyces sp. A0642]THA75034.1 hypothetical protein E6R60_18515 [Streptomyces sp. A0642]